MVKQIDIKTEYVNKCCKDRADNTGSKKIGFSLVEVLVSMLILSLFFLASTKVLSQKQKVEFQKSPHGYYECYKNGEQLYAHRVDGNIVSDPYETVSCNITPPKGVNFVNLYYIAPGVPGVPGEHGEPDIPETPGMYYNSQEPIFNLEFNYSTPEAFLDDLQSVGIDISGAALSAEESLQQWQGDKLTFYNYLRLSHPDSRILSIWRQNGGGVSYNSNSEPPAALLIAW